MRKYSFLMLIVTSSLQAQIKFDTLQWDQLLKKAKSNDRLIFLAAYASWCEPCQEMEEYVFTDLEVGNYYNRNFINVRMDMEAYPGVEIAERFAVGVYPGFLFVDGNSEIIHRSCGAMDANDFLHLGEIALNDEENLKSYEEKFTSNDRSTDFMMNYLALLESVCLDAEKFAMDYLSSLALEELKSEAGWAILAAYNWDIYSREFQYLLANKEAFADSIDPNVIEAKLYDTYLDQYQEVYVAEELHDFGMRSLLHSIGRASFSGSDTLQLMMNLHYAEYTENWDEYASYAIDYARVMSLEDPVELSELAWKFYLFIENQTQLEIAAGWAKKAVDKLPEPAIIDTYASLQFKLGNRKKAIELSSKALEMAKKIYEDTSHFEYQLQRFRKK